MAGNFKFDSASPESNFGGNYLNVQRGNYSVPNLDRSGSFRESNECRMFGSGKSASRGSGTSMLDMPPLHQCLMLEPIVIGDPKNSRSGELRRVLGFFVGSSSEDNILGAAYLKASPPAALEELKRFRAIVADSCDKASGRAKRLDDHLHKLNKYVETMTSKLSINERAGASNLKMGTQIHRSPSELVSPRLERPKNLILNKRARTSVGESRAEYRNNGFLRQPLVTKDRDMLKDSNADLDVAEEKICRLPVGGKSWDKKTTRKRSVGAVCSRPSDRDAEPKRSMHHKLTSEPGLQSCDSHGLRTATFNGASSPAGTNARAAPKNEQEKSVISSELTLGSNKERLLPNASVKLNIREDNSTCPSPVTKGKASRAPRGGSATASNTVASIARISATLEACERPPSSEKNPLVGGTNVRKRSLRGGSSSTSQWGFGQGPPKISCTRMAKLMSHVTNNEDVQLSSEGCSPSDFGARLTNDGANNSILSEGAATGAQISKVNPVSVNSPARLSESEESGAGENRLREKGIGNGEMEEKAVNKFPNVGFSAILAKKNKCLVKEESSDGVRRQGRSGRVASVSRPSISPPREKMDNAALNKPLRSNRSSSDKNGSKSRGPLKKRSVRKGFTRLGSTAGGSPDFTGESDDDREELMSAANMAYNSSSLACPNKFWKKVEVLFASPSTEEKSFLAEQLKLAEERHDSLSLMFDQPHHTKGDQMVEEISLSNTLSGQRNRHTEKELERQDLTSGVDLVDQFQSSILLAGVDSERLCDQFSPLYQRVLSALIIEDEESEENEAERYASHQKTLYSSPDDMLEFVCGSTLGVQMSKSGTTNRFLSCNGYGPSDNHSKSCNVKDPPCNGELSQRDDRYEHSNGEVLVGHPQCDPDEPKSLLKNSGCISSHNCQYEQMRLEDKLLLELESVGLYPETVPELHDEEDDLINKELFQLQSKLYEQTGRKKKILDKLLKESQRQDKDARDLDHVAMDRLVELAYKKLLASRGNRANKNGIPKVSKQVALAFTKRTLARCRKFDESGVSCFREPALRDIISAVPPRVYEADALTSAIEAVANGSFADTDERGPLDGLEPYSYQSDQAFAKNGPISNRGRRKEVPLDDVVGCAAIRSLSSSLLGAATGKRSERERDKDAPPKNGFVKAARALGNFKGERKTKTKQKQKTAQLSTSGNGHVNNSMETTHALNPSATSSAELINSDENRKRDVGLVSSGDVPPDSLKDTKESSDLANLPLNDIDAIEELGAGSDLGGPQDLNSWFNDIDGLQEHDSMGLDIPMDDLSDLNMF